MAEPPPSGAIAIRRGLTARVRTEAGRFYANAPSRAIVQQRLDDKASFAVILEGKDDRDMAVTLTFTWEDLEAMVALCQELKDYWENLVTMSGESD